MDMGFVHGLEKAIEIVETQWTRHNDDAGKILHDADKTSEFYRHMEICSCLNDILMRLEDCVESFYKASEVAV